MDGMTVMNGMIDAVVDEIMRHKDRGVFNGIDRQTLSEMVRDILIIWEENEGCRKRFKKSIPDKDLLRFIERFLVPAFEDLSVVLNKHFEIKKR